MPDNYGKKQMKEADAYDLNTGNFLNVIGNRGSGCL
jgi:hypothetical protein